MGIQAVNNSTITLFEQWKDQLSKTDWKVHSFIVLGYLLVGIGIALSCASPFIAFVIHPMILTTPILPIALGALAFEHSKYHSPPPSELPPSTPIRGLDNAINNTQAANCWINACLQLLFHLPAFKQEIEKLLEKPQEAKPLTPLLDFYKRYQKGEPVNSQELRIWLSQQYKSISPNANQHSDPLLLLDHFLKYARHSLPPEVGQEVVREKGQVSSIIPHFSDSKIPAYYFDLLLEEEENSLPDVFKKYFRGFEVRGEQQIETIRFLESPPEDFSISIGRGVETGEKQDGNICDAMKLTLFAGERAHYNCDGFICHEGWEISSGHYISYFFENGHWYQANDKIVKWISPKEAEKHLSTACFIHYARDHGLPIA